MHACKIGNHTRAHHLPNEPRTLTKRVTILVHSASCRLVRQSETLLDSPDDLDDRRLRPCVNAARNLTPFRRLNFDPSRLG